MTRRAGVRSGDVRRLVATDPVQHCHPTHKNGDERPIFGRSIGRVFRRVPFRANRSLVSATTGHQSSWLTNPIRDQPRRPTEDRSSAGPMTTRPFWSRNDTVAIACQPPVIRYDAIILEVICSYKCVIPPDIHRTAAQTSSQDASAATYKVLHHEATSNAPPRIRPVRHSPKALIGQHGRARRDRHKRRISSPFSCINSGASSSEGPVHTPLLSWASDWVGFPV